MRRSIILLIVCVWFFVPFQSGQAQTEVLDTIDRYAHDALQLAKLGRIEDARRIIEQIGMNLDSDRELSLSADEWRILMLSYQEVNMILDQDALDEKRIVQELTKFRLVVDAITTDYHPLWLDMEPIVIDTVDGAVEAFHAGDVETFRTQMDAFFATYELLYPSLVIDVPFEKVQRVDSHIQYVKMNVEKMLTSDRASNELALLQDEVRTLFTDTEEDEADPSLWWVIITTGGIIVTTLSYVGYRKYRGEKEKKRRFDRSHKY